MGRNLQFEVVQETDYTDFSTRSEKEKSTLNNVWIGAATAVTASLATYAITTTRYTNPSTIAETVINPTSIPPILKSVNAMAQTPLITPVSSMVNPEIIQTGFVAESSMDALATILTPVTEILMAISLPIAGVIIMGAGLLVMMNQKEKGLSYIFNCAIGYIIIQMSPLFISMLRGIGQAL